MYLIAMNTCMVPALIFGACAQSATAKKARRKAKIQAKNAPQSHKRVPCEFASAAGASSACQSSTPDAAVANWRCSATGADVDWDSDSSTSHSRPPPLLMSPSVIEKRKGEARARRARFQPALRGQRPGGSQAAGGSRQAPVLRFLCLQRHLHLTCFCYS